MSKLVSLIMACYNDQLSIFPSIKRIITILDVTKYEYELIFIDDASQDGSKKEIERVKNFYPKKTIKTIFHDKNIGRGGTVKEGIINAKGDMVGFLDIDLEVSENYLPAFILAVKSGADVVIGSRVYKIHPSTFHRHLGSVIYPFLVRKLLELPFRDTEAGYKFFNRRKILSVAKQTINTGWFWDTEIVARAFFSDLKIVEIPVLFIRRPEKKSSVKFLHDSLIQFVKLVQFKKAQKMKKRHIEHDKTA